MVRVAEIVRGNALLRECSEIRSPPGAEFYEHGSILPNIIPNHPPVIKTHSFGVPIGPQDMPRQAPTPNMLATPNTITPQQVNRSLTTPPPSMPTYQKSQALQALQPQLFKPQ
jgi:hypothetical protein